MKYDLKIINDYIERGLIQKQIHPTLPLSIYNYSRTTQYDGLWDDITLACRGLVLDNDGNVIAKPFPKFFNYEELVGNKFEHSKIPNEDYTIYEKMDGSLGICFNYNGEWIMATRGSFTSEQAIKGRELLDKYSIDKLDKNNTYLFEIIYTDNRIVVDYKGVEKLVLLSAFHTESGVEVPYSSLFFMYEIGFELVTKYKDRSFEDLKLGISKDKEGYVIRFNSGMRMKIKGDEYVRLHRILTNFSSKDIWELLFMGEPIEPFLERVPDEFDKWVREKISSFNYAYYQYYNQLGKTYDYFRYGKYNDKEVEPTKKEFAEYIKDKPTPIKGIMFAMWDGKDYDKLIWNQLKPKYEKPFRNEN